MVDENIEPGALIDENPVVAVAPVFSVGCDYRGAAVAHQGFSHPVQIRTGDAVCPPNHHVVVDLIRQRDKKIKAPVFTNDNRSFDSRTGIPLVAVAWDSGGHMMMLGFRHKFASRRIRFRQEDAGKVGTPDDPRSSCLV